MELVEIGENVLRRRTFGERFGVKGGRFVRIGGELYAEGSEALLESTFLDPVYTSLEDIVHFSAEPDYIEQSQALDEIELNTFSESTPLLETGVGSGIGIVSGGAAASAPTSALGVGVGLGTAIIGTGLGIGLFGGAVLPGHKNIGPGNEPDPEGVDVDDNIAFDHDVRYGAAETQADVREADRIAIDEFDSDWQETGNIHSIVGRTGLQIKKTVEHHTGVLYPSSLPTGEQWQESILQKGILILILILDNAKENLPLIGVIELLMFGINGIELDREIIYLE